MVEEPKFDYKYDLIWKKSFSARLSMAILVIAASVFLVAMLAYLYVSQESVKEETAVKARTQLHDAVMQMRLDAMRLDTMMTIGRFIGILETVKPYAHAFTLLTDDLGKLLYVSDSTRLEAVREGQMTSLMSRQSEGMQEVLKGKDLSLLIFERVEDCHLRAAVVCSRIDILASYHSLIAYGAIAFILGLVILFSCCAFAIWRMVHPLHQFAASAMSIADGNLDAPLPEIHSEDELLQLRNSFEYMQNSLKRHIDELQVTTSTKERMQSELTIAHDIQMGMISTDFPQRGDLDLYASMVPAKEVGGDLYDFIVSDDELFFIIGDVAGKGVPASLYMAVTRTLFRNLAGNYQRAANIMREINHAIADTNEQYIFVTLFVGVLDLKTHYLSYCNAAHNAPILIPADGPCRFLDCDINQPVGIERYNYEEQQMAFPPGSALLLYTDGLTEAVCQHDTRRLFGDDRLLHDVEECRTRNAHEIVDFLNQQVRRFADGTEQSDDLTVMLLRHTDDTLEQPSADVEADGTRCLLLKNEMAEVGRLRSFVLSVCREQGTDGDFAKSLYLALEEGVANVINYAYPKGTRGHVALSVRVIDGTMVWQLRDSGVPFDPTQSSEADTTSDLEERPIGGLGIYLMRTIMDTMSYERTADGHNQLTLTKKL